MPNDERYFIVSGPCRDYDLTQFCEDHYHEALEFAAQWLFEAVDGMDFDESRSVSVALQRGDFEVGCWECQSKPAQPAAPASKVENGGAE